MQSEISLWTIVNKVLGALYNIWNYVIFTTIDKQTITLGNMIVGIVLFIFGLRLAKHLSNLTKVRLLSLMKLESHVSTILERIIHYSFIVFITLLVLDIAHVPLTVFTLIGSALAIGVGFGSQNILNNFISGLIIMVEQPVRVGDFVQINENIGRVIMIGARCIQLRTNQNVDILVPNSMLLQNTIINWTLLDNTYRASTTIPISQDVPTKLVEELLMTVLMNNNDIIKEPPPQVFLVGFEAGAAKYEMHFWIDLSIDAIDRKKIISDLHHAARSVLQTNNVSLAISIKDFISIGS